MRILAKVSYNGYRFFGWQKQPNLDTIQQRIETALSQIFDSEIIIYGSGRTDRGVHAKGQMFHFDVKKNSIDLQRLKYSLNKMLCEEIKIISLKKVKKDFHCRYDAKCKCYLYQIKTINKDPFDYQTYAIESEPFDYQIFKECLSLFVGKHTFLNFTSKEEDEKMFEREIYSIKAYKQGDIIKIYLTGNGFMRYMVRYIIGTCLECSKGKITKEEIVGLINDISKRNIVSYKGKSEGLYLYKVFY